MTGPSSSEKKTNTKEDQEEEATLSCQQWLPRQRLAWMLQQRLFYENWTAFFFTAEEVMLRSVTPWGATNLTGLLE